jgi:hypothetical protein
MNNRYRSLIKTTLGAAVLLAAGASQAALTPTGLSCGETVTDPAFTDCAGAFEGNDKNQQTDVLATILAEFGLAGVSYAGASDDASSGPFSNSPGDASGTLDFDFAIDSPFVLSLKAGDAFSLFYFDGAGAPISSIDFTTLGVNINASDFGNGLSHASVYAAEMVPGIPEPETYALMLAGLAAVGFMSRRRRQQA